MVKSKGYRDCGSSADLTIVSNAPERTQETQETKGIKSLYLCGAYLRIQRSRRGTACAPSSSPWRLLVVIEFSGRFFSILTASGFVLIRCQLFGRFVPALTGSGLILIRGQLLGQDVPRWIPIPMLPAEGRVVQMRDQRPWADHSENHVVASVGSRGFDTKKKFSKTNSSQKERVWRDLPTTLTKR